MKSTQLLITQKKDGEFEYVWDGSKYAPVLISDVYELCGEPAPICLTKIRFLPRRRCYEYVRNDTWLGILLPFYYRVRT